MTACLPWVSGTVTDVTAVNVSPFHPSYFAAVRPVFFLKKKSKIKASRGIKRTPQPFTFPCFFLHSLFLLLMRLRWQQGFADGCLSVYMKDFGLSGISSIQTACRGFFIPLISFLSFLFHFRATYFHVDPVDARPEDHLDPLVVSPTECVAGAGRVQPAACLVRLREKKIRKKEN